MFHWHGFPSDLDRKAEFAYLVSILPETPPVTRTLVAYGLVSRLWAHAATCADEDGRIMTREHILDTYLGMDGASTFLLDAAYLDGEFPGVIVVGWSDMNAEHGRNRQQTADRVRRHREAKKSKVNASDVTLHERYSNAGNGTVTDVTPTGQDRTGQESKTSSATTTGDDMTGGSISPSLQSALAARADALRDGDPLACGSERPPVQIVDAARSAALRTPEKSLFDDDTTPEAETAPKRPRKPAKRADGTATDARVKPIIEAWDRIYLARFGAPPMVRPNYAQVGKLVRNLDPSMTAEAVTELMDLGLRAASNDTDPFTQRQWSGLTLPDMLSAKRLTMAHALRKSRDEERWQRRHG